MTRNEILYSLNKPEDFILAIVEFHGDDATACATSGSRSTASRTST